MFSGDAKNTNTERGGGSRQRHISSHHRMNQLNMAFPFRVPRESKSAAASPPHRHEAHFGVSAARRPDGSIRRTPNARCNCCAGARRPARTRPGRSPRLGNAIVREWLSWGIALFEYLLQVPANRIGHEVMSVGQIKVLQEVITLLVFVPFSFLYLRERLTLDYLWTGLRLLGAVFFIFRSRLGT